MDLTMAILAAALFGTAPIGAYIGAGAVYQALRAKDHLIGLLALTTFTLGCVLVSAAGFVLALDAMKARLQ